MKATAVSYGLLNKFRLLLLRGWAFVLVQRNELLWELHSDTGAEWDLSNAKGQIKRF